MQFRPMVVHESATPDQNEVLVSGVDEHDVPMNVTLRDAPELRAELLATPPMIPNPARPAVEAKAFAAAVAHVEALTAAAEALAKALADAVAARQAIEDAAANDAPGA